LSSAFKIKITKN